MIIEIYSHLGDKNRIKIFELFKRLFFPYNFISLNRFQDLPKSKNSIYSAFIYFLGLRSLYNAEKALYLEL